MVRNKAVVQSSSHCGMVDIAPDVLLEILYRYKRLIGFQYKSLVVRS